VFRLKEMRYFVAAQDFCKKMKRIFAFLIVPFLLQSCDDGDIIVTTFNFSDAELQTCGDVGNYVFYKVNPEAQESLSLKLGTTDSIYKLEETKTYTLNGTSNFVNYRTYDGPLGNDYFCSSVPPTSPGVTVNYLASSGQAVLTKTFIYDDNDGVPFEFEQEGDTDGDGIPDVYDLDDDGDNVPTSRELNTEDLDDDDPFTNPKDTDGDGTPDFLDADDDGDGVITRYEDEDQDLDPTNDVTDVSVGPDYLNPAVANTTVVDQYRLHKYTIAKSIQITLKNAVLVNGEDEITQETLDMGTIENVVTTTVETTPTVD
jgi:hypothetical protein